MATRTATTKLSKGIMASRIAQLNIKHSKLLIAFLLFLFVALPAYAVDTTPPVTTAAPGSGIYNTTQSVTLTANESAAIYYTTDGSTPTLGSATYSVPIDISATTVLKFFGMDLSDNVEIVKSATYTFDTTPPTGTISINNGTETTLKTAVTLTLTCSDTNSCSQMQFSNDNISWSTAETYSTNKAWTLPSENGMRTVYVMFKDSLGNWSNPFTDTIMLDIDITPPSGTIVINNGNDVALQAAVTLALTCADASGCSQMQFSNDNSTWSTAETYSTAKSWTLLEGDGTKTVGVQFKDTLGNWSGPFTDTITLNVDITPPTGTISINSGSDVTLVTAVTLTLTCIDPSVCAQMQFSNDNTTWSTAETYSTAKSWTLSEGDGTKTVGVKFKDTLGNWSDSFTDTITLDTSMPVGMPFNVFANSLPKTGQTTSYSAGDDGAVQSGVAWPNPRFTITYRNISGDCAVQTADCDADSSNDVVTDNLTGLVWTRDGNAPGPAGCGPAVTKTWQAALTYAACLNTNNHLGHNDWRLPNINELQSIENSSQANIATWQNAQGFVNVQPSYYWSSSTYAGSGTTSARVVLFSSGSPTLYLKTASTYARCVRGQNPTSGSSTISLLKTGQTTSYAAGDDGALQSGAAWPNPRFTITYRNSSGDCAVQTADCDADSSNDIVTDNLAGLIWTRSGNAPGPAACGPGVTKTWQAALTYAACLNTNNYLGHNDWRLPNLNELRSLVNNSQINQGTWQNAQGFVNVQSSSYYWSSTTVAASTTSAWTVGFNAGYAYALTKTSSYYVHCVRGQNLASGHLGIFLSDGAKTTKNTDITIQLNASHPNGVAEMMFSDDNVNWFAPVSYATTTNYTLPAGDGIKTVYVSFRANGNTSWSQAYSDSIILDTTAPITTATPASGLYSVQTVTLSANETGSTIYYTLDGSTPTTSSTIYSSPISIATSTTLKFFAVDNLGNTEEVKSETYTIDTVLPAGSVVINEGAAATISYNVTLTLSATDANNVTEMKFRNEDTAVWTTSELYATTKSWTLSPGEGTKTVYAKFMDSVGNWSVSATRTIIMNSLPHGNDDFYVLPKTGQTNCYNAAGTVIPCAGTGQDGEFLTGVAWPSTRFTVIYRNSSSDCSVQTADCDANSTNDVVKDNLTGLVWERNGRKQSQTLCNPESLKTWQDALDYAKCLNGNPGYNDWRVPNVNELRSLVNDGQSIMSTWLNANGFVNIQSSYYWTATSKGDGQGSDFAIDVIFGGGQAEYANDSSTFNILCVRGQSGSAGKSSISLPRTGQTSSYAVGDDGAVQSGAAWPKLRFMDNGDETISDYLTGLVWTKDGNAPGPAACNPGASKDWQGAFDYAACLNTNNYLGRTDWRLPNIIELSSLMNFNSKVNPAAWLKTQGFVNVQSSSYWSSTTLASSPASAWMVLRDTNTFSGKTKSSPIYVHCVRGQSLSFGNLGILLSQGAVATKTVSVPVWLSATDTDGIEEMMFSNDNLNWSAPVSYVTTTNYTLPSGDGTKTVYVKFKDAAGFWSDVYSDTIILKTLPPITSLDSQPAALTNSTSAVFTFSSEAWATFECRLDGGAYSSCTSPKNYTGLAEGNHSFFVRATDTVGNVETPVPYSWAIDSTPPLPIISEPSTSVTRFTDVTYTITYTGADSVTLANNNVALNRTGTANGTVEVSGAGNSSRTVTISGISGDGTIGISLSAGTANDTLGNTAASVGPSTTFIVDNHPPQGGNVFSILPMTGQVISYGTKDDGSLQNGVDYSNTLLIDNGGSVTDTIFWMTWNKAADYSGVGIQQGITTPDPRFVDNGDGTITDNLTGLIWLKNSSCFGATGWNDALAAANGLASGSCNLTDGSKAGDWRIPNIIELTSLLTNYSGYVYTWLESVGFASTQATSHWSSTTRADDTGYAWRIIPIDDVTVNVDSSPKGGNEYAWPVRSKQNAPSSHLGILISRGVATTSNIDVELQLRAIDTCGVAEMSLSNDGTDWSTPEPYAINKIWSLSSNDGTKTVYIKFEDFAGQWSDVYSDTIILDTTPPVTIFDNTPAGFSNVPYATFTFTSETGAIFECQLDSGDYSPCSSPVSYSDLSEGGHSFNVRATDTIGNIATPVSYAWIIDFTTATMLISAPSAMFTRHGDVTYTISYIDADNINLTSGDITLNTTGTASGFVAVSGTGNSSRTVTISGITGDGTLSISIAAATASDAAGNTAAASGPSATFIVDNTLPVVSAGANKTKNVQFTQTATATDANNMTYVWTKQTGTGNITFGSPDTKATTVSSDTNGTFTLRFTATDEAGNSAYSDMTLIWDTVAPNAPVVAGTTPNNSATPTWTWTSGGNGGNGTYRYSLDNSDLSSGAVVTTGRSALPATGLSDAIHTLYVQERDIAGNWSSSGSFAILVDATAPNTSASIPGGLYKTVQNVTLTCNDGTGTSGCKAIYYTTDNNTPTQSSAQYSTPIAVNADTTLKFLSVDFAGNPEAVHTIDYTIDTAAPAVAISAPLPASQVDYLDEISGTATDSGSGVSLVELQIVYNTKYLNASGIFTTTPMWLPAIGTTTWSYYVSSGIWANNATYTVKARATDTAENVSILAQTTFTKVLVIEQAFTTLSLDLSTQTMLQNGTLTASGKLTRMPDNGTNLAGKTVTLLVTGPTGTAQLLTTTTYDIYGHYIFNNVSGFTQKGSYTLTISFAGGTLLAPSTSESKVVLVGASAGYAIIVEGKITGQEGLESHNKTANRIYGKLKDRGFVDDNIQYFNYQAQTGVDTTPSKGAIQFAVETWALTKMNGSPAPLFIIMVDHGSPDIFYLNNETITPTELAAWVATLETGLSAPALAEKRVIIVGSCYSGSFVSALAHSGRVIVTSAAEDEESYKGPNEPDNIRSGEFFLEEFFKELGRGRSLGQSFAAATDVTEVYTRKGGNSPNGNGSNKYLDNAMQHPLLEDNDDGKGSNVLSGDSGDGARASNLYLGIGISYDTNSAANPADITAVTETKHLVSGPSTTVLLWARANDDNEVSSAWIEIRTPSKTLAAVGGSNQLEVTLTKVLMSLVSDPSGTRWEADYNAFTESGMYEIFYFVRDVKTSDISQMKRSVVYKDKDLNTPPGAFTLVSPVNGSEQKTMLIFDWNDSIDPDADFVTYSVMIATDAAFTNMVYLKEELPNSYLALGSEAGLKDLTTYYWKVRATDPYGAYRDVGQNRNFSTNNTNGLPGFIYGYVLDAATEAPVSNATIYSSSSGTGRSAYNGAYVLSVPTGDMTLRATATGYQDSPITNLMITPGSSNNRNIRLNIVVYSLTVGKSGTGTGSITSNPAGISCGATCSQTYNANTVVTLTATPAAGSSFTNWSGACTGTGTCSVTMNAAKTVSAVFTLLPDSTPTAFKFMDQANVALNTVVTSNTITVTGINTAAAISIVGGSYSVNNGIFTSASNSVTNGAVIRVQLTSSATFSTAKAVTLTIGGVSDTFTVTTLKGTTAPIATYTPATLPSFGNQLITTISAAKIVKVTNTGTAPLMILNTLISGTNAGQFSKTTTCPTGTTGLATGETCTIRVMFKPTATGLKNASLQVNVSLPALSKAIALTGTGTAPVATVTPTVLSFGTITNKTTSPAKAVKVTNTGTVPLFLTTSITGTNPAQFAQVSTCPTGTASLATGATCTINVTFKPTGIGLKNASLSIDVAAPAVSKKVTLTGTGK